VDRPDRKARRTRGKSVPVDAEAAARTSAHPMALPPVLVTVVMTSWSTWDRRL
jgi:hypothetical protein